MNQMDEIIKIAIPLDIESFDDDSLKVAISSAIVAHEMEFHPLLERLIEMGDARVTVVDDSLTIDAQDVDVNSTGGIACGMFESDYYAGCKDVESMSDHEVTLEFTFKDKSMVFEIELPPAWIPVDD